MSPVLIISGDDGKEQERIDLTHYSTDKLHELMTSKGFTRKVVGGKASDSLDAQYNNNVQLKKRFGGKPGEENMHYLLRAE